MKHLHIILLFLLFTFIAFFSFTSSPDLNQDLGRHIKLGEIITQTKTIPSTNVFSYTNPDFPFINHHWLSEVVFYQIAHIFGLNTLIILKAILIVAAFGFIISLSILLSNPIITSIAALLFAPLFIDRALIRPELFGFLFFSILLFLVFAYPKNRHFLFAAPIIIALWVNMHITFVFGIFLLFILLFQIFIKKTNTKKQDMLFVFLSFAVLFVNPHGIQGILYPFFIFKNYGYAIAENQSLFFLKSFAPTPFITYFFLLTPLVIYSLFVLFAKKRMLEMAVLFIFYSAALFQIRHMPFFILAAIPFISRVLHVTAKKIPVSSRTKNIAVLIIFCIFTGSIVIMTNNWFFNTFDSEKKFGFGFTEHAKNAADFLKKNQLRKNIFNNFDIGGYLIYKLYPDYSFFVDNRPEAYPADFLKNTYIKIHMDQQFRNEIFQKYTIKTVFFAHTDQTQWGRTFLEQMYRDASWSMVYVDSAIVIFTRETQLPDIRNDPEYFKILIDTEKNYLNLLRISRLMNIFQLGQISEYAFAKARTLNPLSCSINRIVAANYQNSINFDYADNLKKKFWYCF